MSEIVSPCPISASARLRRDVRDLRVANKGQLSEQPLGRLLAAVVAAVGKGPLEWELIALDAPLPLEFLFDSDVDTSEPYDRTARDSA